MRNKVLILIFFMLFAFIAHADVHESDVILSTSPKYPNPNQNVTATISTNATDLNKANIHWSINGKEFIVGVGKKNFSFDMGGVGESLTIQARIDTIDGQSIVKNILTTPAEVDMLWEGDDSYSPPFYKGKTLVPEEGTFKVVAMPNLTTKYGHMNPENLSYSWILDSKSQPSDSGWGKNYLILKNSYLDDNNIVEVTASDISGSTNAGGKITLNTVNPEIYFYKNDPKFGILYNNIVGNGFNLDTGGATFIAEPYFFSPKNIDSPNLNFNWIINGSQTSTPTPKNVLSIKPNPNESGTAKIRLTITNIKTLSQTLTKEFNVNF
ncbi:MAG: hypothetical protein NT068_00390 [Candidatus Nomurabacteria bacterium]|nr:hypothetical protein [Candidatus Nomurabacteria bacterium]